MSNEMTELFHTCDNHLINHLMNYLILTETDDAAEALMVCDAMIRKIRSDQIELLCNKI